jgi:hypothetical protein
MNQQNTFCSSLDKPEKYEKEILFPLHINKKKINDCMNCDIKRNRPCEGCNKYKGQ